MKWVLRTSLATVLGVSSLLFMNMPAVFAAGNNCLWNGSSSASFNTAANWSNCGGTTPGTGDSLTFDNTSIPGTGANLVDNITGVTFANLTFQGSGSTGYTIGTVSSTLALSGNITDTTSNTSGGGTIDVPITLSGATPTVSVANSLTLLGSSNSLTTGSNTVTFSGAGIVTSDFPLVGTGTLNFGMSGSGSFIENSASPNFTGAVNVTSGTLELSANVNPYPDYLSAVSGVTVSNGATLYINDAAASSGSIAEPITAGGTGTSQCTNTFDSGSVVDCGAIEIASAFGGNITLAGPVILTANSQFNDNDTITITGALSGAFTVENAAGTLVVNSSNNTSGTANGTYSAGGLTTGSGGSGSSATAPKTPDTGLAKIAGNPIVELIVTGIVTSTLLLIARKRQKLATGARNQT